MYLKHIFFLDGQIQQQIGHQILVFLQEGTSSIHSHGIVVQVKTSPSLRQDLVVAHQLLKSRLHMHESLQVLETARIVDRLVLRAHLNAYT